MGHGVDTQCDLESTCLNFAAGFLLWSYLVDTRMCHVYNLNQVRSVMLYTVHDVLDVYDIHKVHTIHTLYI